MKANDALLAYSGIVAALLFWRTQGDGDDDSRPPMIFLVSASMRAAYFAWGTATHGWPPSDADFLPYFSMALDGVVLAHLALESRQRFKLIAILCMVAALSACVGDRDWRAASCAVSAVALAALVTGKPSSMGGGSDRLRGAAAIGALTARAGLSLYDSGNAVYIADGLAITASAYAALHDESDDDPYSSV